MNWSMVDICGPSFVKRDGKAAHRLCQWGLHTKMHQANEATQGKAVDIPAHVAVAGKGQRGALQLRRYTDEQRIAAWQKQPKKKRGPFDGFSTEYVTMDRRLDRLPPLVARVPAAEPAGAVAAEVPAPVDDAVVPAAADGDQQ
eukprot:TRINITY_DN21140_c0_g1_i1.p2 TRINITY_DN21140_c0_g1~~TRINITY_DN21140_c0_g1_i1.p2  ORF type:complete len:143 (+),score=14.32 TRINITY_DN21140_c0_g1_i1:256-684(+)